MDRETREQCIGVGVLSAMSLIGGIWTGHWQNIALAFMGVLVIAMIVYLKRREIMAALEKDAGDNDLGPQTK